MAPLALTDSELDAVMAAARPLPVERRDAFLLGEPSGGANMRHYSTDAKPAIAALYCRQEAIALPSE
jgi:hypothetical protein